MALEFPQLKKYSLPADILNNHDWYEKSWSGVLFPLHIIGVGCVYLGNKRFKDAFRIGITFVKQDRMVWLWDMHDLKRIRARLLKLVQHNPAAIRKYFLAWQRDWKKFKQNTNHLDKINFSQLSDHDLYQAYLKLRDSYIWESSLPYLVDSFLTAGESDWLAELISQELKTKVPEKRVSSYLATLTAPVSNSFSSQEAIDLLQIVLDFQKNHDQLRFNQHLIVHAQKYYWVENSYYPRSPLTVVYFRKKIEKIIKNSNVRVQFLEKYNQAQKNKARKEKVFQKLQISRGLKRIIKTSELFTAWQDTRKSGVFMANHFFFKFLKEIGRRVGLPFFEICYATDYELADILFKKKFNRQQLQRRRKNGCIFFHTPRGIHLMEGATVKQYPVTRFLGVSRDANKIQGVVACPGIVTGKVRVVLDLADFKKFKVGEILVTNNTTPDFVPIMKKAAAIITEQGGITAHAAIVSRELKKPCVIGTKIATKILKTGEIVRVDATSGIITKL